MYRPPGYFQGDATRYQWQNCVLSAGTDIADRVTLGRLRPPAWQLRYYTGDTLGGVSHSQMAAAVTKATSGQVTIRPLALRARAELRDLVASGRPVGVTINCRVTRYTARRTGYFTGLHEVYLNQFRRTARGGCRCELNRADPHGEYLVEDPGTREGYGWWSAGLVYRAAEAVAAGIIWVAVGRDTEGVTRRARKPGRLRRRPNRDAPSAGRLVDGADYRVVSTARGGTWPATRTRSANGWHRLSSGLYARGDHLR